MIQYANAIQTKLTELNIVHRYAQSSTGSIYIEVDHPKIRLIRIANHSGHKVKPKTWELRLDVSSKRYPRYRTYALNALSALLNDLGKL